MVLMPTLASSGKKTNIWSVGSSLWATRIERSVRFGWRSLENRKTNSIGTRGLLRTFGPGSVSKLVFELVQSLVQLVLRHEIAAVSAHLHHSLANTPQLVRLRFVVHCCAFCAFSSDWCSLSRNNVASSRRRRG